MHAISLASPGVFERIEIEPPPAPGPGEALINIERIGICGTDLHAFRGRQPFFEYPRILGHELGVTVAAVGEGVTRVSAGDRCAVEPYLHCGRCIACRRGRTNCCADLKVLGVHVDGGMRPRIVVPADKLHVSAKLSTEQLALVETLGIGAHAVERAAPVEGENTLVFGAGPIGLGIMQFALERGARVIAADINPARLEFCQTALGVQDTILVGVESLAKAAALTAGDLPTLVFDATGNPASMNGAFEYVAPSGRLVLVGIAIADISFHDPLFHRREITLLASRNALPGEFTRIIELIESGRIDTSPWISHRTSLAELIDVFPSYLEPATGVIKAMIEVEAS
jgi:2-desacetyl-2-hydroxyethyl bacteriochlorophyllide A dehydrogenase